MVMVGSPKDGVIFVGPVESREEAIVLAKKLLETTNSFFKASELK